jgi:ParB-like chromosome segregation protein Spo0J
VGDWPADEVERRPIEELVPYARNARTHSEDQISQIAASIREWGFTNPILVDEDGGIIAGHGRLLAARKLGLPDVPVMVARNWTPAQKRAYVLADNKLALNGGWDDEALAIELTEIRGLGFDASLTGFSIGEIDAILGGDVPTLDELEVSAGAGASDDLWPTIKLRVPPDVKDRFDDLMSSCNEQEEWAKFDHILAVAGPLLEEELAA